MLAINKISNRNSFNRSSLLGETGQWGGAGVAQRSGKTQYICSC